MFWYFSWIVWRKIICIHTAVLLQTKETRLSLHSQISCPSRIFFSCLHLWCEAGVGAVFLLLLLRLPPQLCASIQAWVEYQVARWAAPNALTPDYLHPDDVILCCKMYIWLFTLFLIDPFFLVQERDFWESLLIFNNLSNFSHDLGICPVKWLWIRLSKPLGCASTSSI